MCTFISPEVGKLSQVIDRLVNSTIEHSCPQYSPCSVAPVAILLYGMYIPPLMLPSFLKGRSPNFNPGIFRCRTGKNCRVVIHRGSLNRTATGNEGPQYMQIVKAKDGLNIFWNKKSLLMPFEGSKSGNP